MVEKPPEKTSDREYYFFALKIFGDFGVTIAAPAIIFVLIGQHFDEKYEKYPLFTVLFLLAAFFLTIRIIQRKAKKYGEEYQNMK
ncbi:MAG: AtpZ/AtpI family protein [Candidatus Paceibacterota bacterium]|nr:AtpZ/AtpI family protein [Patescibacteria group bacterium]